MKERIVTSIIGIILAVLSFLTYNTICLNAIFAAVIVLGVCEVLSAYKINMNKMLFGTACFFSGCIPMADLFTQYVDKKTYVFIVIFIFSITYATLLLIFHEKYDFFKIGFSVFISSFISIGISSIVFLRDVSGGNYLPYILISLTAIWGQDTCAYFAGSFFGKHKLTPKISPKKTVEGAIGGVMGSVALVCLVCVIYTNTSGGSVNYGLIILFAVLMSFSGIVGDLFFSIIKRQCEIKDFGYILPGHGGILDRFDSIIFAMPLAYLFICFFPMIK